MKQQKKAIRKEKEGGRKVGWRDRGKRIGERETKRRRKGGKEEMKKLNKNSKRD